MLLEARRGGEGLPAVRAGVSAGPHVLGADVPLQVAGVGEHLRGQSQGSLPCRPSSRRWVGLSLLLSLAGKGLCCQGDSRPMTSGELPSLPQTLCLRQ